MRDKFAEKKKCREKLTQMEKYLPFLDFMINKIKKKSKEGLWECPLNKFQNLRSMIAEKSSRHNWDAIIKVEEVIQKLMVKIDYKEEQSEENAEYLPSPKHSEPVPDSVESTNSMDSLVSIKPFSATTNVMPNVSSLSHASSVHSRPQDSPVNTVDVVTNSLKSCEKDKTSQKTEKESLKSFIGPKEAWDDPLEADLGKDLDGFDLTEGTFLRDGTCGNSSGKDSAVEVPKMVASQQDLLSTSRMKLMISLEKVLGPSFIDRSSSQNFAGSNSSREKTSDSQIISALDSSSNEVVDKSTLEKTNNNLVSVELSSDKNISDRVDKPHPNPNEQESADANEKPDSVPTLSPKSPSEDFAKVNECHNSESFNKTLNCLNTKEQTLKERLWTDISEIHKVPGKSVGGSLRSLKCEKNFKKDGLLEEKNESFTTDKEASCHSSSSSANSCKQLNDKTQEKYPKSKICDKPDKNSSERKIKEKPNTTLDNKERKLESSLSIEKLNTEKEELKSPNVSVFNSSETKKGYWKGPHIAPGCGSTNTDPSLDCLKSKKPPIAHGQKPKITNAIESNITKERLPTKSTGTDMPLNNDNAAVVFSAGGKNSTVVKTGSNDKGNIYDTDDTNYAQQLIEETTLSSVKVSNCVPGRDNKNENQRLETALNEIETKTENSITNEKQSEPLVGIKSDCLGAKKPVINVDPRKRKNSPVKLDQMSNKTDKLMNSLKLKNVKQNFKQYYNVVNNSNLQGYSNYNFPNFQFNYNNFITPNQHMSSSVGRFSGNISVPQNPSNLTVFNQNSCKIQKKRGFNINSRQNYHHSNASRSMAVNLSEAKSYIEYKRMKKLNEDRLKLHNSKPHMKKEESLIIQSSASHENSMPTTGCGQTLIHQANIQKPPFCLNKKQQNLRQNLIPINFEQNAENVKYQSRLTRTNNQTHQPQQKASNELKANKNASDGKKNSHENKKKMSNEKRLSQDGEETISPLESLYEEKNISNGRCSYGLKNFKIPKKGAQNNEVTKEFGGKPQENITLKEEVRRKIENLNNKTVFPVPVEPREPISVGEGTTANEVKTNVSKNTAIGPESRQEKANVGTSKEMSDKVAKETPAADYSPVEFISKANNIKKTEDSEKKDGDTNCSDSNPKSETFLVSENDQENKKIQESSNKILGKEEITQELVEALIRKSFQSGEGKLLLAQAKLFEKLARKLNSEKLKTIQKIINSESDNSSLTSDSDSEDNEPKITFRKSEKTSKRKMKKKKFRKIRKLDSSSEESDRNCEEKITKESETVEEEKSDEKTPESNKTSHNEEKIENKDVAEVRETITEVTEKKEWKLKKESSDANLRNCISNKKNLRKQGQKKLLEQILNEKPESEPDSRPESRNSEGKEPEQKAKPRSKAKTELDRLHDDIRNMFISSGVVTSTGVRMCRMLKESGGSMVDLDLVKESAKMVKEQKLQVLKQKSKKPRSKARKSNGDESHTNAMTTDQKNRHCLSKAETENVTRQRVDREMPITSGPIVSAENFTKQPCVLLHKLDFTTWDYGVNVSERDIILCMGNKKPVETKKNSDGIERVCGPLPGNHRPVNDIFLARNIRKYLKQSPSGGKKRIKKGIIENIIKKLPLKKSEMADEHTSIQSKAEMKWDSNTGNKFGNDQLLKSAFKRNKSKYKCLLCSKAYRNIVDHYKSSHEKSEILISRLNVREARSAIRASMANNNGKINIHHRHTPKKRIQNTFKKGSFYRCIFCGWENTSNFYIFFKHIVAQHTGEHKYRCPANDCCYSTNSRKSIELHSRNAHAIKGCDVYQGQRSWCPVPDRSKRLYGYICSKCHYVQISLARVNMHVKMKHSSVKNVKIFKIDMSSKILTDANGSPVKKTENRKNIPTNSNEKDEKCSKRQIKRTLYEMNNLGPSEKIKRGKYEEAEVLDAEFSNSRLLEGSDSSGNPIEKNDPIVIDEMDVNKEEIDNMPESILLDSCFDVNTITGNPEKMKLPNAGGPYCDVLFKSSIGTTGRPVRKLKVGPLEAQILDNSVVLYECFVKGCVFSTKVFDLFEKHVKISHAKTKWNGICNVCYQKNGSQVHLTSYKLIYALNHLKHHEKDNEAVTIKPLSSLNKSVSDVEPELHTLKKKIQEKFNEIKSHEVTFKPGDETNLPRVPLLRVRNLLGDRLSTPKETKSGFMPNSDNAGGVEENTVENSSADAAVRLNEDVPAMFTIENVRSLKPGERPDESNGGEEIGDLIEHSFSCENEPEVKGKEVIHKQTVWNSCGIPVRSCPTRTIAIRPDCSTLQVDVGQLKVVKAASVSPVVLNPIPTPIRTIATLANPQPASKFTVQPVMVSISPPFLSSSKTVSVMVPVSSCTTTTPSSNCTLVSSNQSPITQQKIVSEEMGQQLIEYTANSASSSFPEVSVSFSDLSKKSDKPKRSRTKVYRSSPEGAVSSVEVDESKQSEDEVKQKTNSLQRLSTSGLGSKSVKDAKIYEEMLTKTKLCHLFKCMAIECSFTCNKESVFTQHIGLHEAQRRMKKKTTEKTSKNIGMEAKLKKSMNCYQCAYCCEVLANMSSALSRHIIIEHGHCIYQCAYCFYRAVSQSYVEIHQNLAHATQLKTSSRIIYKCKPLSRAPPAASALEKQGRRQSVRPYHCDQCGAKFFITQEFLNHLTAEHQAVTAYTCHICKNLCFKADRLINHYKLHSYCTYQCAYCLHGTETEKEMVFHLCNFHFSQPAYMYVRALAENQTNIGLKKPMKKKKVYGNQLDSLKVIAYENDKVNPDCIVEAEPDEENQDESSKNEESADISAIAAELGISIEPSSSVDFEESSTLNKEIGNTPLSSSPFSLGSESSVVKSCSSKRNSTEEKDVSSVPLGQLSLEVVSAVKGEEPVTITDAENVALADAKDKKLKLNEIIINLQQKDKPFASISTAAISESVPKEERVVPTAFHKLPPVVLSRITGPKNVYPPKTTAKATSIKKSDNSTEANDQSVKEMGSEKANYEVADSTENSLIVDAEGAEPKKTEKNLESFSESQNWSLPIKAASLDGQNNLFRTSDSFSDVSETYSKNSFKKECNISEKAVKNAGEESRALKPPIIRVEDFPLEDVVPNLSSKKGTDKKTEKKLPEPIKETHLDSPEVVVLEEEKTDKVLTVTIDSDDEKEVEENEKSSETSTNDNKVSNPVADDRTIRKEMEKLRNQIANETDCLLFDDMDVSVPPIASSLSTIDVPEKKEKSSVGLLSPIEEAISSLNKKLEEEGEKRKKEKSNEGGKKSEETRSLPRTRSFTKDRARRGDESLEKSDSDDGNVTGNNSTFEINKKESNKVFKTGLSGKNLFICGGEKCDFSADEDTELKNHLYSCNLLGDTLALTCSHCFKSIKQVNAFIEHLKHHGILKYLCGLCTFKSGVEMSMMRHVKQKHKCDQVKSVPNEEGCTIYYPKNHKLDKQDFETKGYSPGDEDKLPLQAVYQVNVKCAKCPYFTKVRSNMVRHLKIHVKSAETEGVVIVPSTAPTNPVPCLDTKERMFDKMTNLAASSQLAQAKEKSAMEALAPEDEAKLPQFVTEQMRYKCCLPDCNYITVDEGMLKHHIKALHAEITHYSCPHCSDTVHVDVRHVTLDKIGYHLKLHDGKLYKCPHCSYFHYQKAVVEKHTLEKHPERRYYVHTVREPKVEPLAADEPPLPEVSSKAWKCGLCDDCQNFSKVSVVEHVAKIHGTKSKYKCRLCDMKSNHYHAFFAHFASRHPGEKVGYVRTIVQVASSSSDFSPAKSDSSVERFDTTPLWQRGAPRVRHIRGILIEEEEVKTKKNKRPSEDAEVEAEGSESGGSGTGFYCPICKKKFCTRNADFFRSHLYQELNYMQFACTLCGKMFVDKKDYEKHHAKTHPDKAQALKQTKEDGEIMFWVAKVIAKQKEEIENKKRQLNESSSSDGETPPKKKKKSD